MNAPAFSPILLVDDHDEDLATMSRLLESAGFVPPFVTANSGNLAQEMLRHKGHLVQLAFFDLRMPGYDGLQLLAWTRSRPNLAHVKIVMITGDEDPEMIERALNLGADGFVSKYPRPPKLAAIMSGITPELLSALEVQR